MGLIETVIMVVLIVLVVMTAFTHPKLSLDYANAVMGSGASAVKWVIGLFKHDAKEVVKNEDKTAN